MSKLILKDEAGKQYQVVSQDEFDEKVNVNEPIFRRLQGNQNKSMADITGQSLGIGAKALVSFRDNSNSADKTEAHNGSGIAFGGDDTAVAISVPGWGEHQMKVYWSNGRPDRDWTEYVAFKSDINTLEQRISALEKQIGGVLTSLYTKLCGTFTSLEVA